MKNYGDGGVRLDHLSATDEPDESKVGGWDVPMDDIRAPDDMTPTAAQGEEEDANMSNSNVADRGDRGDVEKDLPGPNPAPEEEIGDRGDSSGSRKYAPVRSLI